MDWNEPSKIRNKNGYVGLLVIVCNYSNYMVVKPTKTTGSAEAIKIILREWVYKFGAPGNILHDRGSHFTSALFKAMLNAFDIKDTMGTPWHSQTQGLVESMNRRINIALRVSLSDEQWQEYDRFIDVITFTLNCLKSTKTGYSAHKLAFSTEFSMPQDLFVPEDERMDQLEAEIVSENDRKKFLVYNSYREMCEVNRKVVANAATKVKYMKTHYDKFKMKGPYPNKDDLCMIKIDVPAHKFSNRFVGPHKIVEKISDWNYIVDIDGVKKVVNISKLKLYKPNNFTKLAENLLHKSKVVGKPTSSGDEEERRPTWDSSSDSEDGSYTIVTRSKAKKRQLRDRQRGRTASRPVPRETDDSEQVTSVTTDQWEQSSNAGDLPDVQEPSDSGEENAGIGQQGSESELNNSFVSATEDIAEAEDQSVNNGEAADTSVHRDYTVDSVSSDNHVTPGGIALHVPAIDDTSILLSDIERHENSRGRAHTSRDMGSRTTAAPDDTDPEQSTGSQDIEDTPRLRSRDQRTSYGLRRKPKETQFFGNPVTALFKRKRK